MSPPSQTTAYSPDSTRANAGHAGFFLRESVGSLGDLGTFVPIFIAMVRLAGMDAATMLVFAGLMSIVTGFVFRLPVAVQPMKAIAALAMAGVLTPPQVCVAGVSVGACLLLLSAFGLIGWLHRHIPQPVLRGVQLAVAAKLLLKGLHLGFFELGTGALRGFRGPDGLIVFLAAAALLLWFRKRWQPVLLGLIVLGLLAATIREPAVLTSAGISLWTPRFVSLSASAASGLWDGALAQLPLTLLNSVFAVALLAESLFPAARRQAGPTRMAVSVGLMNLLACPFGAMPACHGSGGLAAQYGFGARTGWSMVILGMVKLGIGLLCGATVLAWLQAFPETVLGVFLLVAGFFLAHASRFWQSRPNLAIAALVAAVSLATGILPLGFACGWIAYVLFTRAPAAKPTVPGGS